MRELLGLPIQAAAHAEEIDQMIILTHWLMALMFVVLDAVAVDIR